MNLPRFRRNDSWIEALGRDVALVVVLVAALVMMEGINEWTQGSLSPSQVWLVCMSVR